MPGEPFLIASMIVSFVAGIVALAMPCCFSVLLPSYFASVFKKRTAIFRMTLIFALGISAILLPIALGVTYLSIFIGANHSLLFVIGGFFMLFLAAVSLLGIQLVPMFHPDVDLQKTNISSVFTLGVFSGVASSCCAPVLAGILVLTSLSSSLVGAGIVGAAYVLGMVFPLLAAGLMLDRSAGVQRIIQGRMVNTGLGRIHSSRLVTGLIFLSMGAVTVILGVTDSMLPTPGSELFNIYEVAIQNAVEGFLSTPIFVVTLVVGVSLPTALYVARRWSRNPKASRSAA